MEQSLKLLGSLLVLTIILTTSFSLINQFNQYVSVRLLASDLENMGQVMKSLRDVSGLNSWRFIKLKVPINYTLFFNNHTNTLEIGGAESFNISLNNNLLYSLNLCSGSHLIQLYHGSISYDELKNETVVFE